MFFYYTRQNLKDGKKFKEYKIVYLNLKNINTGSKFKMETKKIKS